MSPDERAVVSLIQKARRRLAILASVECVAWAAAAIGVAATLETAAGVSRRAIGATAGGLAAAAAVALLAMVRRRSPSRSVLRQLERADPTAKNVLFTAGELLDGTLSAVATSRDRVFMAAANAATRVDLAAAFPRSRAALAVGVAAVSVGLSLFAGRGPSRPSFTLRMATTDTSRPSSASNIIVTIRPPAYTRERVRAEANPVEVRAIEGSEVSAAAADNPGVILARVTARTTSYLAFGGSAGQRRTIPIIVMRDALPSVTITAPGRDLVRSDASGRIRFDARATDDFGLRSMALRYTKVSGSGEQFQFVDGEIPLRISHDDERAWRGTADVALGAFGLKDGDMLVYRAVAADERPGDGSAGSDAFFIEISRHGVAAGDSFTLPEEESRYALSQQMLIMKTERLHQQRAGMTGDAVREAALNLAVEQRMIRAEFVFMLGGEIEDEEVEAARSTELQEGRLANRGQRDLRAATVSMSQAEKLLTAVDLPAALTAERAAVAALQRSFSRDRYILRALASRTKLDSARRLSGSLAEAHDWRRLPAPSPPNRRPALLQDVLSGIIDAAGMDGGEFPQRARLLAEEALRIDAASTRIRTAAEALQRAAADASSRSQALGAAAAAVAEEARRSSSGALPLPPTLPRATSGSFADLRATQRGGGTR